MQRVLEQSKNTAKVKARAKITKCRAKETKAKRGKDKAKAARAAKLLSKRLGGQFRLVSPQFWPVKKDKRVVAR